MAQRAEAYLKTSGLGDTAYFGPEPEFFIFDGVRWNVDMSGSFVKIDSEEAPWSTGKEFEHGNSGHRPAVKGGYFPVPRSTAFQDIRSEMCLILEQMGIPVEVHHHEVANAGPERNRHQVQHAGPARRLDCSCRSTIIQNVAHTYGKTATFMPKPIVGDNGSGMHVHQSVWKDGKNLFAGNGYAGLSRIRAVLHRRHHQARPRPERHHQPGHELVQAPGAGLRSAGEAGLLGQQPFGLDPHSVRGEPEGPPHRSALPGSADEPVPGLLGAADGRPGRRR